MQLRCDVSAGASEMRAVRDRLRALLVQLQLDERLVNAVLDVTHELLVNAHRHGEPPVRLSVVAEADVIRADVQDGSASPARLLAYRPGYSERGLGLHLVRRLASHWGQNTTDQGKTVWATFLRRPPRTG